MALFGRKSQNSDVPEDLQQYYNSNNGSGALKWILRIVAGLIVLALIVWGGVWLAHKISSSSKGTPQTTQTQSSQQQQKAQEQAAKAQADAKKAADEAQKKAADAAQKEQQAQQQAAQQPSQVATGNGSGTSTTPATGSGPSGSSTTTPATGSQQTPAPTTTQGTQSTTGGNLPNTGPGETAAVLFAAATVLGTGAHLILTRKRQLQ